MIFDDGYPAGSFGEWGKIDTVNWSLKAVKEMTDQERTAYQARIKSLKEEHDRQQAERWAKGAAESVKEWNAAVDVVDHPYLKLKQVDSIGLRQDKEGRLLVPVYDADENLQSLQRINADGAKRFLTGGKMSGGWYFIDGDPNKITICEGYATGVSIHQATGRTVYVGFNAGNLLPIAKIVKNRHPGTQIIVCCDNDQWTEGNPGLNKGREAAEAIGASVAVPIFKDISTKPTDFNDLMALEGPAEVRRQIMSATEKAQSNKLPPLTPGDTKIKGRLLSEPPPAEFIMSCRGYPFMKKGIVSLLVSAGGLGKTYLMLCLAMLLARGGRWGCFEAEKPLKTLVLCAEDDQEEVDRRLWTIGNGIFPENLHVASIAGKIGPLMKLDGENPVRSEYYTWLKDTIEAHKPLDVLFLDPLSRLYGLTENRNEHATAFITALESLTIGYGMNIMTSHHANKVSADQAKAKQGMARGASGFIDGCRLALGLTEISDDDATNYGIEGREQYFKLDKDDHNK
ncbi:MAG: AAA family ATPase [Deltaproteobacteria bacterium]|nr:AAA family ATPase [Deltaproteobacteria bacterium]